METEVQRWKELGANSQSESHSNRFSSQGLLALRPFYLVLLGGPQGFLPTGQQPDLTGQPLRPQARSAWPADPPPAHLLPQPHTSSWVSLSWAPGQPVWWAGSLGPEHLSVLYLFSPFFVSFFLSLSPFSSLSLSGSCVLPGSTRPRPTSCSWAPRDPSPTRQEKTARGLQEQLESP